MIAIITEYKGPSAFKGSRMLAKAGKNKRIISLDPEWDMPRAHQEAARALCIKMRWDGYLAQGSIDDGRDVFVWVESPQACNLGLPYCTSVIDIGVGQ